MYVTLPYVPNDYIFLLMLLLLNDLFGFYSQLPWLYIAQILYENCRLCVHPFTPKLRWHNVIFAHNFINIQSVTYINALCVNTIVRLVHIWCRGPGAGAFKTDCHSRKWIIYVRVPVSIISLQSNLQIWSLSCFTKMKSNRDVFIKEVSCFCGDESSIYTHIFHFPLLYLVWPVLSTSNVANLKGVYWNMLPYFIKHKNFFMSVCQEKGHSV